MSDLLRRIRSQPLGRLPARVARSGIRRARNARERKRARNLYDKPAGDRLFDNLDERLGNGLHGADTVSHLINGATRTEVLRQAAASNDTSGFRRAASLAMEHTFDMLGSGPVSLTYETIASGAFGSHFDAAPGSAAEADQRRKMSELLDSAIAHCPRDPGAVDELRAAISEYRPIDWHVDFKSGHRWEPRDWYMDVPIGQTAGADIKVPWELSRGHHLVALALAGAGCGVERANEELSLQILDWIAANPSPFGANWRSAMDVSIRAANWCWAIAIAGEERVPATIRYIVASSLSEHALFIESHLDYAPTGTTNHYLADIVGLLHISAALPDAPGSDRWAALSLQELVVEMGRTVNPDGSSYEGSAGYHRLIAETFFHGTLVALRLPASRRAKLGQMGRQRRRSPTVDPSTWDFNPSSDSVFPEWYHSKLRGMTRLTHDLTKPNGRVSQFGDQDSGRFLKLDWVANDEGPDATEDPTDHRHLAAISSGLYGSDDADLSPYPLERAAGRVPEYPISPGTAPATARVTRHEWVDGESVWYPDGGCYIARSGPLWLCVRCENPDSEAPTGHRHNDQLSFELNVDGADFFIDPGTGVYTADPNLRNRLRATESHNTVSVEGVEQRDFASGQDGLFLTRGSSVATPATVDTGTFTGVHRWSGLEHRRSFELTPTRLVIEDRVDTQRDWEINFIVAKDVTVEVEPKQGRASLVNGTRSLVLQVDPGTALMSVDSVLVSPSYGQIQNTSRITLTPTGYAIITKIEIDQAV